jgi:hypothetical protein
MQVILAQEPTRRLVDQPSLQFRKGAYFKISSEIRKRGGLKPVGEPDSFGLR